MFGLYEDIWSIIITYLDINEYENILNNEIFSNCKKRLLTEWKRNTRYELIQNGSILIYLRNGKRHRDFVCAEGNDLPAIIDQDTHIWYKCGQIHRDHDKPAFISKNLHSKTK